MAYSVRDDIQTEFKGITFSGSTAITSSQVDAFIDQADSFINAKIGMIYEVPLLIGGGLELLKEISIKLVAHRIKRILEVKTGATQTEQGSVGDYRREAIQMLKDIVDRKMILDGAIERSTESGINSFAHENGEEYSFEKNKDQW